MAAPEAAHQEPHPRNPWDQAEPNREGAPCYSQELKADLLPGTFVLLRTSTARSVFDANDEDKTNVVARIVDVVSSQPISVRVNIFKYIKEIKQTEGLLCPDLLQENHLRHLTEVVQTFELRVVPTIDIVNLSFVFTMASLQDPSNLFFTCQGMAFAFLIKYRYIEHPNGEVGPLTPPSLEMCQLGIACPFLQIMNVEGTMIVLLIGCGTI